MFIKRVRIALVLIIILFNVGCRASNTIYYNVYIASIGLEYKNDEYIGYFFLPSSLSVGNTKNEKVENTNEIASVKGKSISELFSNFDNSNLLEMNLKHISSFILDESILDENRIEEFIDFVKNSNEMDYNFYVFVTNESIDEIYKVKNPNNESIILTSLVEPSPSDYTFLSANPIHYLNFCRDYYEDKVVKLPLIEIEKVWGKEDVSLYNRGLCVLTKENYYLFKYDSEPDFQYLKDNLKISYTDISIECVLTKYRINISYKKDVIVNVDFGINVIRNNIEDVDRYMSDSIKSKITKLLHDYNYLDLLNLKYNNSINKKIYINVNIENNDA